MPNTARESLKGELAVLDNLVAQGRLVGRRHD
jgi:hypothetical protein